MRIKMFASSFVFNIIIKLSELADESLAARIIRSVLHFLGRCVSCSIFGRITRFFIRTDRHVDGSAFYKIADKAKKAVLAPVKFAHRLSETSVLMNLARTSFFMKTENLLAMFVFAVFLVPHKMWNNLYGLAAAFLLAVMYIIDVVRKRGFRDNVKGIWLPLVLFAVSAITATVTSAYVKDSVRILMFFATAFLLCMLVYGTVTSEKRLTMLSRSIYWAVFLTGIMAVVQKRLGVAVDPSLTDVTLNTAMPGRAFATFGNPNNYAEFLLIFLPYAFVYAMKRKSTKNRTLLLIGMAVPFVALLMTYSRSGWLGFIAAILVFVALYDRKLLPLLIFLGICAIPLMPRSILNRILTIGNLKDSSSAYRLDIWTGTFHMLKYFWYRGTGIGPIAFKEVYPLYAVIEARPAPHAHMLFLEIWAEMGMIGLLSFVYLTVASVRRSLGVVRAKLSSTAGLYSIAALSSMAGIMTIGLFEYVWFYPRVLFAFFISLGITMATIKLGNADSTLSCLSEEGNE